MNNTDLPILCALAVFSHFLELTDVSVHENEVVMFVLPGIEGCAAVMAPLCRRLKLKVCVLQLGLEPRDDIISLVGRLHRTVKTRLSPGSPYILLGYSFGCLPMLKLAKILEREGHNGHLFCVDGSPDFLYGLLSMLVSTKNERLMQNSLLCHTIDVVAPNNEVTKDLTNKLVEIDSYEDRIQCAVDACPIQNVYSNHFIGAVAAASFDRLQMVLSQGEIVKVKASITLLRPKETPPFLIIDDNYGLDKYTDGTVTVRLLEGNHVSIIENKDCANIINRIISEQRLKFN